MMKKVLLILCILLVGFSSLTFASPWPSLAQKINEAELPQGMPETINLLDTTQLYPKPDSTIVSWDSLSPQKVEVVQTQFGDRDYANPSGFTWIQIRTTWLGNRWIKLKNTQIGVIRPFRADLNLASDTPLYDRPSIEAANGGGLSSQTVHTKAEFVSPSGFYAIQIESSWLGDQWLIYPQIKNGLSGTKTLADAISPDYGDLMKIDHIHITKLGERTFVQGQLILEKDAWLVGRINHGLNDYIVSGKLSFWNEAGEVIAQTPYAVHTQAGQQMTAPLFLPVDKDVSSAVAATLQDTFPFYFGLPIPPLLNLTDSEGKVLLGILRKQKTEEYTVARAWISGMLPGSRDYRLTLTFYDDDNRKLGLAHVHQRLNHTLTPDQTNLEGGGENYLIDIVGSGDWTNYHLVKIDVDQVSAE
ncbi:hypothetical protein GK047_16680 [Paenibacillus sp. SYP-B3998]|uniref:Uncharacterized protein n=1 Tax=Paenibacillus sp. SYP-B3998 TaxID=2678564 RepID=A0A6G4A010_9BACL|nr:hypothetical protein [Paenibacillus sp. SYP-B3998]NEW07638.1 hypothetical protein [Paenibacillus sp. SYP-B3998]